MNDIKIDMSNLLADNWNTFFINDVKEVLEHNKISLKEFLLIEYIIVNYPNLFLLFRVGLDYKDKIIILISDYGESELDEDLIKFLNREFEEFEDLITFELW